MCDSSTIYKPEPLYFPATPWNIYDSYYVAVARCLRVNQKAVMYGEDISNSCNPVHHNLFSWHAVQTEIFQITVCVSCVSITLLGCVSLWQTNRGLRCSSQLYEYETPQRNNKPEWRVMTGNFHRSILHANYPRELWEVQEETRDRFFCLPRWWDRLTHLSQKTEL